MRKKIKLKGGGSAARCLCPGDRRMVRSRTPTVKDASGAGYAGRAAPDP